MTPPSSYLVTSWRITIYGPPRTKKTHNVVGTAGNQPGGRAIVLPSKLWRLWVKSAQVFGHRDDGRVFLWPAKGSELPARPLNCAATFYRDANRGDAVGYYQGLADLLAKRGVLLDDVWITQWDQSRLAKDALSPRVELILSLVDELAHTPLRMQ